MTEFDRRPNNPLNTSLSGSDLNKVLQNFFQGHLDSVFTCDLGFPLSQDATSYLIHVLMQNLRGGRYDSILDPRKSDKEIISLEQRIEILDGRRVELLDVGGNLLHITGFQQQGLRQVIGEQHAHLLATLGKKAYTYALYTEDAGEPSNEVVFQISENYDLFSYGLAETARSIQKCA